MTNICKDPDFIKNFDDLRKMGGKSAVAARKAEGIIRIISESDPDALNKAGKTTRYGEHRIKSCVKYDLGGGYRMVCSRHGTYVTALFIGTHDDCHRRMERSKNRAVELKENLTDTEDIVRIFTTEKALPADVREEREFCDRYERELMDRVDDQVLEMLFGCWCRDYSGKQK